ncbi:NUDIX domain-containing protein [Turicibacter sanguinis]|nr:NUDIX domain-containing protein [Turicibacter sanguinis]MTP47969.1 NUDIX domain-containing protein [Turicibacter sanguinis]MTP50717.1 NUDIX domain-containing protein [Turicibacter sanguinis]MTQ07953.1 NUDIX domain-containing protein [Turicibacter sanguinis]
MELNRTMTATVYIIYDNKVLLHMHKKHKSLFPIGGHMNSEELPEETAIREVYEEAGLDIELINNQKNLGMTRVRQLNNPQYTLLENIGHPVENIDFIYFAVSNSSSVKPQKGESKDLFWFSKDDIINCDSIKEHIKLMALEALDVVSLYNKSIAG